MKIVVQKYGGTSVGDVERIRRVAARVVETRQQGKQVCVVVSAMGKSTDELVALARQVSPAPPRRELDMLLTCGERISMALLSMAIQQLGQEAISFTGSQCGILTNDRHSGARIIEVRPVRVQDELERGRIVIVAGFQGVSYKREITTLGRGGSDTTAVALAAALGAEYCEICSDVDGVFTADPNVVDDAAKLESISHDEMAELAAHGARVLHPAAVEYAQRAGIALWARATDERGGGTRVGPVGDRPTDTPVTGIAGKKNLVRVALTGTGAAERLAAALAAMGGAAQEIGATPDRAVATLALDDLPDWAKARGELERIPGGVEIEEGLGAVSVVGDGLGGNASVLHRALVSSGKVLGEPGRVTTSPFRITISCRADEVDDLTCALHDELIGAPDAAQATSD